MFAKGAGSISFASQTGWGRGGDFGIVCEMSENDSSWLIRYEGCMREGYSHTSHTHVSKSVVATLNF